jgi:hypothetical protein
VSFEKVPRTGSPLRVADDDVRVHLRLAILVGDVTDERRQLDLLGDRDRLVLLRLPVEVAERDAAEGAEPGEVGASQPVLACELRRASPSPRRPRRRRGRTTIARRARSVASIASSFLPLLDNGLSNRTSMVTSEFHVLRPRKPEPGGSPPSRGVRDSASEGTPPWALSPTSDSR